MRSLLAWTLALLASLIIARVAGLVAIEPLWPAAVAIGVIVATRSAASGLAAGVLAGGILLADGNPLETVRVTLAEHFFPQLDGAWHVGALVFTLQLGAFAGLLEASGGFTSLLNRLVIPGESPRRRVLGGVYGMGLLCFFDGLANSMLMGRIARPAVDRAGISREKLAWVVDSTSAPVACVAFISTWIAAQLSLIQESFALLDPYALFFRSIPANAYCLLTLLLVPFAILRRWEPRAMSRFVPRRPEGDGAAVGTGAWRVLVPLVVLALSIAVSLQLFSGNPLELFSLDAWRRAAGGNAGPVALIAGALAGLATARLCFPRQRMPGSAGAGTAALQGAAGLLPALVILLLAWTLGSIFEALGAADMIRRLLSDGVALRWFPLVTFAVAALTAFLTGSSWGTMALLMPLTLGSLPGGEVGELVAIAPMVIAAVFGGAVFGDHASPFSDTTVVSALAAGCEPVDHVTSQLPYALTAATASLLAYVLMGLGLPSPAATAIAAAVLLAVVHRLSSRQPAHP